MVTETLLLSREQEQTRAMAAASQGVAGFSPARPRGPGSEPTRTGMDGTRSPVPAGLTYSFMCVDT